MDAKRPRLTLFLHFHKSGGSTLCELARSNGEKGLYDGHENCEGFQLMGSKKLHLPLECTVDSCASRKSSQCSALDDWIGNNIPVYFKSNSYDNCATCARKLQEDKGTSFVNVEWPVQLLCHTGFKLITVLRDPISRFASHLVFYGFNARTGMLWIDERTAFLKTTDALHLHGSRFTPSNFYIRTLNGYEVYDMSHHAFIKAGNFTDDLPFLISNSTSNVYLHHPYVSRAFRLIQAFDAVLVLEEFDEGRLQLEWLMGWDLGDKLATTTKSRKGDYNRSSFFSAGQLKKLCESHRFDLALYELVVELAAAKTKEAKAELGFRRAHGSVRSDG